MTPAPQLLGAYIKALHSIVKNVITKQDWKLKVDEIGKVHKSALK